MHDVYLCFCISCGWHVIDFMFLHSVAASPWNGISHITTSLFLMLINLINLARIDVSQP